MPLALACWMVRVPLPKVILSNAAVQRLFGHPAARGVGFAGVGVDTVKDNLPFLMSVSRALPDTGTGVAGFCPGDWFPPGLVQVVVPVAFGKFSVAITLPLPRPAMVPVAVAVIPLSTRTGPLR